ncbi:MAG: hypothetical protein ABSG02_19645 [Terriglobales bacterium]|jgi:hypothetical protein
MRKFCKFSLFFALFAAVCLPAVAQSGLDVNVPFNFIAAGKTLPPGQYKVAVVGWQRQSWFISNNHTTVIVMSTSTNSDRSTHGPSLVFLQSGGTYSLAEIWDGTHAGQEILRPSVKQTLVAQGGKYVEIASK